MNSSPDVVFSKFVDANPVSDTTAAFDSIPDMEEVLADVLGTASTRPVPPAPTPRRGVWVVAVAAFVIVLAVGGLWLTLASGPAETEPATPPDPIESLGRDAVVAVERWLDAVNQGDIETVMEMSSPSSRTTADQRVHEWVAGFAANGMPTDVLLCEAEAVTTVGANVNCQVLLSDSVAIELGVAELLAPFQYRDGLVEWRPYEGSDISLVNAAYSDYLRQHHPSEYEVACSPSAYEPGSVVQDRSLALTGPCAELVAPLADDVVRWIRGGRPSD